MLLIPHGLFHNTQCRQFRHSHISRIQSYTPTARRLQTRWHGYYNPCISRRSHSVLHFLQIVTAGLPYLQLEVLQSRLQWNPILTNGSYSSCTRLHRGYFFIFNYFTIYKFIYLVNVSIYLSTMIHQLIF